MSKQSKIDDKNAKLESKEAASTSNNNNQLQIPEVNIIEDLEGNEDRASQVDGSENGDGPIEEREEGPYHKFTADSYRYLVEREIQAKKKAEDKKNKLEEGRLVDGQLKFGDDDDENNEDDAKDKDPMLVEGNNLPESFPTPPKKYVGTPIEELDPYIKDKSFVVIAKKFRKLQIFRFTPTRSFFIFSPMNILRRACLYMITNQFIDWFIILTIVVNCILLALPEDDYPWMVNAEYLFLAIYTCEMIIKMLARGLIIYPYTYLRDGWNWLDFVVVLLSYIVIIVEKSSGSTVGNVSGLRTFRVIRALKTISVIPGLKTIIQALLKAMKVLAEVMVLMFFCMMVFSMFALQVYAGILRNKCVGDIPADTYIDDYTYSLWVKNSSNWWMDSGAADYRICGNASGAGLCPTNYTCLTDIGPNPRFGYSNFDNFGWCMLNSFQLITLDFWEDPYNKVIRANGPWNIIFFIMVVFFGSYYLINLMIAVVSMSYEEEAITAGKEKEEEKKEKKKKSRQQLENSNYKTKNEKTDKSKDKDKDKNSTHLKVMSAVNGGSSNKGMTASDTSLTSVGNGVVRNGDRNLIKGLTANDISKNDTKATAKEKSKPDSKVAPTKHPETNRLGAMSDSIASWDKTPDGYENPLMKLSQDIQRGTEDLLSNDSDSNNGDPPRIIIKVPKDQDNSDDSSDDDDEELIDRNAECCSRCCRCYIPWLKFQNSLYRIVSDLMFELGITLCIVLNVIVMAMAYYPMSTQYESGLEYANYLFTGIFTLEAMLKIIAMSKHYFKVGWNIFDLIIVVISFVDIGLDDIQGLNAFRAFRLLRLMRVFKLAQSWSTMRRILAIILSTLGALANLTLVLGIIMYIFAVMGFQLFAKTYTTEVFGDEQVRWHFDDFFHAFFLIFRVLCGEWIEPLWDCMRANGQLCMAVFLPALVVGNFMVLNLFLALLLNAFASDSLKSQGGDKEDSKMKKGWMKLKNLFKSKKTVPEGEQKPTIADLVKEMKLRKKAELEENEKQDFDGKSKLNGFDRENSKQSINTPLGFDKDNSKQPLEVEVLDGAKLQVSTDKGSLKANGDVKKDDSKKPNGILKSNSTASKKTPENAFKTDRNKFSKLLKPKENKEDSKETKGKEEKLADEKPAAKKKIDLNEAQVVDDEEEVVPGEVQDCWPVFCYKRCCKCLDMESKSMERWMKVRRNTHKITEHKVFEYFILIMIFTSSIALCFEDIYLYQKTELEYALWLANYIFFAIFFVEMVMKLIGLGFKTYFTNFWTILDFCIVLISLISIVADSTPAGQQISTFKALRTLRALRPLRAISRWQSMKIVVNALVSSIPAIINVLTVCFIFWLIFSIAGVQLFAGKFYKCVDQDNNDETLPISIVNNKTQCEELIQAGFNYRWKNSKVNFDHVLIGYVALFQVATFEGWMELMIDVEDHRDIDLQPSFQVSYQYLWFFIIFIIVGSFFTLNLFIGVIIDNFNTLKKKYEGGFIDIFLTRNQKNYYNTMKKLGTKKPQKTIKRPKNAFQGFFFDVSMSTKFELAIVILIVLNMIAMAVEHYKQPATFDDALDLMNIIFTTIFTLEAMVKIIGMRWHYFRRAWNVYDFIIVIVSIIGVVIDDLLRSVFITPTLLRVVRVFRIGRVLRLVRAAKGLRKLLFALVISLPALFNIGCLLALIVFIYAIFGMSLFGHVKVTGAFDDVVNFQTFGNSLILLFRLTTAGGWNDILEPLMINEDDGCSPTNFTMPEGQIKVVSGGDCGQDIIATLFMFSFTLITYLIIVNMYIAIILENYSQAHEQEEVGITEDDFEMFYVTWERYDPHATQFIKYDQISDFVGDLEQPLGMPKPNEIALVAFDLPIYNGDRLHCLDILTALVRHVLGGVEETEEFKELKDQMDEKYKESFPTRVQQQIVSTTMRRKKEDVAAKTLQRAYRQHKAQDNIRKITQMAMQDKMQRQGTRTSLSFFNDPKASNNSNKVSPKRPESPSATKSIKASTTAQEKKKTALGNKLEIPKAGDIKLPSENDS